MAGYTQKDIDELAGAIRQARKGDRPFNLLTGAGCSVSAGIPLAPELVEEIHKRYPPVAEKLPEEKRFDYGACMSCLGENQQRDLLQPYLENAKVNWAHIAIAAMMEAGYVARVLTFNFDAVLARACGLMGLYPATYDFGAAVLENMKYVSTPAIIHLHGQGHAHRMINTSRDTATHAEKIRPLLSHCLQRAPILVIGYSGQSDAVFPILEEECSKGYDHVFWANKDETANHAARQLLKKIENISDYFGNADADLFLIDLARALKCWPPLLFTAPNKHLLNELEPVTDFPVKDSDTTQDVLSALRKKLVAAAEKEKREGSSEPLKLFLAGKWVEFIEAVKDDAETDRGLLAAAFNMQGIQLCETAQQTGDPKPYKESFTKFAKAVELKPDDDEAYNNWGTALSAMAKQTGDEDLFRESFTKYAKAVELKPDDDEAYYNWGTALSAMAEQTGDEDLFRESFTKYAKAVELKPDDDEAYYNWGTALSAMAEQTGDEDLFRESFTKFAKAVELKPDYGKAYNNWGTALLALAEQTDDEDLFRESFTKFAKAVELKPHDDKAYNNWGTALLAMAEQTGDEDLFRESFTKYAKAVELKPDYDKAYNNWGNTLSAMAKQTGDEELFRESFTKFAKAVELKPNDDTAYYNWGNTLSAMAKQTGDEELFRESFTKFAKAVELKPDDGEAYYNWGTALSAMAEQTGDEDLFRESFTKFAKAVELKPDYDGTYNNWGLALMDLATMTGDKELFQDARAKLEHAESLNPDRVYNLACLFALTGNTEACREKLFHCKDKGTLPNKAHLLADEDLESVRDLAWFAELISGME